MMIKGVNRTVIEVNNPANRYFERAFLFVRPAATTLQADRLQRQADCFVANLGTPSQGAVTPHQRNRNRRIKRWILAGFWWTVGLVCGGLLTWLCCR